MANAIEVKVPDIGGTSQVDVIEILVQVGDSITIDTPLVTLESDKASMEIPSPVSGKVSQISLKVGDKVSEGSLILLLEAQQDSEPKKSTPPVSEKPQSTVSVSTAAPIKAETQSGARTLVDVTIPDIGGAVDVDVIDVLVCVGMQIEKDQALVTLEGDKATMDIPSPYSGIVTAINIKLGAKVSQGAPVITLETTDQHSVSVTPLEEKNEAAAIVEASENNIQSTAPVIQAVSDESSDLVSAGPAVRRLARELGVSLALVKGSGRKTRITKEDVQEYVKAKLSAEPQGSGFNVPANPVIDFSKFGEIETKPLSKIKKATGVNVHRSWITIPHVTQFDEADITDLEAFRKSQTESAKNADYKLTVLAFVCAVVSKALSVYPQFNASLDAQGTNLIYKKYCNIGIAVETPSGLVVPVIKGVDKLSVADIAREMARLSLKAREKGLMPGDMSGACFTISSLGGIGGTAFTPIVNSPEVAILGLSRSAIKPVYQGGQFVPRLMLPLSLSYDHRVIDGAEAARFTRYIADCLADIRKILL